MEAVVLKRIRRDQVEGLHVEDLVHKAFLMHFNNLPCDAAECKTRMDVLFDHLLAEIARRCKACAAGAHLHGEAIVEIAGGLNDVGGGLGNQ